MAFYFFYFFPSVHCLNRSKLTWEKVEDQKMEHCYIAPDYASEVRIFQVPYFFTPLQLLCFASQII